MADGPIRHFPLESWKPRDGVPPLAAELKVALSALQKLELVSALIGDVAAPVALVVSCPMCHARHYDEGVWATRAHHTHACQSCGHCWRPAVVTTVGVRFLPGFKNAPEDGG